MDETKAPEAREVGGRRGKRRGRRPLSQRARSRGIDVKPIRGRPVRHERAVTHEGHALARGKKPARLTRQQAGPTLHEIAVEGSRDTAKQRRARKTLSRRRTQPRA